MSSERGCAWGDDGDGCQAQRWNAAPGEAMLVFHLGVMAKRLNDKGNGMESQVYRPADSSPDARYYIPANDDLDDTDAWQDYAHDEPPDRKCIEAHHTP